MSEEKKNTPGPEAVPDWVPRYHAPGDGVSEDEAVCRQLDLARWRMDNDVAIDESAASAAHQSGIGRHGMHGKSYAKHVGPTTSPTIAYHDVPFEQLKSAHPYCESDEIEELMEMVYGKSVYEAAAENFKSFDRETLQEILSLSELEVEALLSDDELDDCEADGGYDAEETDEDA